jgi:GT2 family glycosyltransferase
MVIVRQEDLETQELLRSYDSRALPVREVRVYLPGAVAARNAGLDVATTDIVAIIDDDTEPHPEWLTRVMDNFLRDPQLGGLGGRDRCFGNGKFNDAQEAIVGKLTWYGNPIGNHHLGFGSIREVDFLKGANMSFRTEAVGDVRFDSRLKGTGAQPSEDGTFSVAVRNQGWKIAYDPAAIVEHFPAERSDVRHYVGVQAVSDPKPYWEFCYNQVVMVWYAMTPVGRVIFFCWSCLVGSGVFPGLVQAIRFTPRLGVQSWRRFKIAQAAKLRAIRDLTS